MLNLNSIMIGTDNVDEMVSFYEKAFGRPADMTEEGYHGWQVGNCFLTIGEHSEVHEKTKEPQRNMFNFETTEVQEEFDKLKAAGATVIKEPYEMGEGFIATLADPDGNYFQLMTPWEEEKN